MRPLSQDRMLGKFPFMQSQGSPYIVKDLAQM